MASRVAAPAALVLAGAVLLLGAPVVRAEQGAIAPSPGAPAAAPSPEVAWIRPEEVAVRADALLRALENVPPPAATETAVARIERDLGALAADLESLLRRARAAATRPTPFIELEDLQRELASADRTLAEWEETLAAEAKRIAEVLDEIARARAVWRATETRAETAAAGEAVARRVGGALAAIAAAAGDLQPWRVRLLAVSDRVVERRAAVGAAVARIRAAATREWTSILVPGRPPLWRGGFGAQLAGELPRVPTELAAYGRATWAYLARDPRPLVVQMVAAFALAFGLRRLASHVRAGAQARALHPAALAWLLALLATPWFHPLSPQGVRQLMALVAVVPAGRILRAAPQVVDGVDLGGLFVLLLIDRVILALAPLPAVSQASVLVAYAIALGLAARLVRRGERDGKWWLAAVGRVAFVWLGLAVAAAVGGWDHLAAVLGRGILAGAAMAVFVTAAAIGLEPLLVALLATPGLRRTHLFSDDAAVRRRRVGRALVLIGAVVWLAYVLRAVGLLGQATAGVYALLGAGVSVGALSISIGTVLAFGLTLLAAMLFARTVTGVLEADVYPRTSMPRGVPVVLSTLVRYAVYAIGFLLALAAAGIEIGQLAILLGGLGVGIGLGLQDLVKNFAAGLTLLLERRVHPGDVVQIPGEDVFGRVLSIGMRATVVRGWNGSEVVVPNADMIATAITNWTLSDRLCRLEVPVGVAYGTDPERVMALLLEAARSDPRVLAEPAPQALFKGFGESSLDFELRAWTDQGIDQRVGMTSDLTLAVHRALVAADVTIPFPQRDLRLASIAPAAGAVLAGRRERDSS